VFKSSLGKAFRNNLAETIFAQKYRHQGCETWEELARTLVEDVCQEYMTKDEKSQLSQYIEEMKFIPGGRYLYYAGRNKRFYNNCFLLNCLDDSREDWANLSWKAESCLTTGGGIGSVYSVYRGRGSLLHGTGGFASGPISKMKIINEIGREVMQGGSRRSAIWAGLHHWHPDVFEFLHAKDWRGMQVAGTDKTISDLKEANFNYSAPLDMTNISVLYDTDWLMKYWQTGELGEVFLANCRQAMMTGEPGFAFNFFDKEKEILRNACTEVTSEDDSDVCNLGSLNFSRISNLTDLADVVYLATKFLICGTLRAELPYDAVYRTREKNRRLGLGLMGLHEWLLQRGYRYEVTDDLRRWLTVYRDVSRLTANNFASSLSISSPVACRAIAPTGSIGILAGTTTGIEPVYAVAIKRRYLKGTTWKYQYVIDATAKEFMEQYDLPPESVESAMDLAKDFERRIAFQADVQDFTDMAISSTINLPAWNTEHNNESLVNDFANTLAKYAHRLRGFTVYPDGSRGGQPLVSVPYQEAADKLGVELEENMEVFDICDISGKGGSCGV
jgi:ribonucleoside-diphosphate reductase alpha chain